MNNLHYFSFKKKIIPIDDPNRRVAIAVIDKPRSNLLLVEQAASAKWGIPKGHLYQNETIWAGALRELYEETNLSLNRVRYKVICRKKSIYVIQLLEEFHELKPDLKEISQVKWTPLVDAKRDVETYPDRYNMWIRIFFKQFNDEIH